MQLSKISTPHLEGRPGKHAAWIRQRRATQTEGEFGLQATAYCCARLDASNQTIGCLIYIAPAAMTLPRGHRIIMQDMTVGKHASVPTINA